MIGFAKSLMPIWIIPLREPHPTGTRIDGKCIGLATIEKYCGSWDMARFRTALKQGEKFSTGRFDFCGYDGTLWCEPRENGDMAQDSAKSTGIVATATIICLSTMNT